jgi:F-type H+-transporting ATPase subunit a
MKIMLFLYKTMVYQPLEQYKIAMLHFAEIDSENFPNSIEFIFLNKYSITIAITVLTIPLTKRAFELNQKLRILNFTQITYQRIVSEMVNVVSFNFTSLVMPHLTISLHIYISNPSGLSPNTPCWTTQLYSNLMLSFLLIGGITLANIDKNGVSFFQLFVPKDVPNFLVPSLPCLEFLSYFIRILSLSIRLFSNMAAGHSLLHILSDMVLNVKYFLEAKIDIFFFAFFILIIILLVIVIFEFIVAFLQAYVFAIMFTIYLNDLNIDH